jgi:hypothetical protein
MQAPELTPSDKETIAAASRALALLKSLDTQPHMKLIVFRQLEQQRLIDKFHGDEAAAMKEFERTLSESLASLPAGLVAKAQRRAGKKEKSRRKKETLMYMRGLKKRWF